MKKISDEQFLSMKPEQDSVVGIRIKDGEFYFLAWMENAPHYRIQQAQNPDGYLIDRNRLIGDGDIYSSVQETKEYNAMYLHYLLDDEGNVLDDIDKDFENEYEMFLTLISCNNNNWKSVEQNHTILLFLKEELISFCDLLRDGDYILVMV